MKYVFLTFLFIPHLAMAGLSCGNPDQGYYFEFPDYQNTIQIGAYEVTVYKNGNRKMADTGLTTERSESVELTSGGQTSSSEKKLSTEVDGYSVSIVTNNSEQAAVLAKEGEEPIRLSCTEFSDSSGSAKGSSGAASGMR